MSAKERAKGGQEAEFIELMQRTHAEQQQQQQQQKELSVKKIGKAMGSAAKAIGSAAADASSFVKHSFITSKKQFPIWVNNGKNGKYCALGWLPYVDCGRSGSHLMTCSADEKCMCKRGCPGRSAMHPGLAW